MKNIYIFIISIVLLTNISIAENVSKKSMEKYASTKNNIVNVRAGPGVKYPIEWQYTKRVPIKIVGKIGNWHQIVDWDNQTGWINKILIGKNKLGIINHNKTYLMKSPKNINRVIAYIEKDKVVNIIDCDIRWCKVKVNTPKKEYKGWVEKIRIWGIQ